MSENSSYYQKPCMVSYDVLSYLPRKHNFRVISFSSFLSEMLTAPHSTPKTHAQQLYVCVSYGAFCWNVDNGKYKCLWTSDHIKCYPKWISSNKCQWIERKRETKKKLLWKYVSTKTWKHIHIIEITKRYRQQNTHKHKNSRT